MFLRLVTEDDHIDEIFEGIRDGQYLFFIGMSQIESDDHFLRWDMDQMYEFDGVSIPAPRTATLWAIVK